MIGWQSDLELVCRDDRNVRCKDLNLENVIELSEWYLVVRGLQNEVAKQTPVNRDTEKFSSGPHHPPGYKEGERENAQVSGGLGRRGRGKRLWHS